MRILFFSVLICCAFGFFGCESKQNKAKDVVNQPKKALEDSTNQNNSKTKSILCFGNSLTAGFGLDENQAWPALLQKRLDSLNMDYTVVNAGISGETTSNGLNRLDWVLNQQVDIFILELGANDMLRGLDVSQTEKNLQSILEQVQSKNAKTKIIVAGMLAPPNMGPEYVETYNSIYPTLAKQYDAALIPFFLEGVAGNPTLNLADGKHPNVEGQKIVLENVWTYLNPLL